MSSRSQSPSSRSLQGLLLVALAGIFWIVAGAARDGPFRSRVVRIHEPNECTYQVFQEGVCQGTIFSRDPLTINEIMQRAGCGRDCPAAPNPRVIPCDRSVVLQDSPPGFTLESMRGGLLLIAGRRIDLNCADRSDLLAVPGIGKRLADSIITQRENRGPFSSLQELTGIAGIGPRKFDAIRKYLRADPAVR